MQDVKLTINSLSSERSTSLSPIFRGDSRRFSVGRNGTVSTV